MTVGKFFYALQNIFPVKLRKHLTVCILLEIRAVRRQLYVNTFNNVLLQNLKNMKPSDALHIIMVRKCGNLLLLDSKYLILHLLVFYSQLKRCSKTTSPNCLWLFRSLLPRVEMHSWIGLLKEHANLQFLPLLYWLENNPINICTCLAVLVACWEQVLFHFGALLS